MVQRIPWADLGSVGETFSAGVGRAAGKCIGPSARKGRGPQDDKTAWARDDICKAADAGKQQVPFGKLKAGSGAQRKVKDLGRPWFPPYEKRVGWGTRRFVVVSARPAKMGQPAGFLTGSLTRFGMTS